VNEEFRPIAEFPGYVVSADAEVWSVAREVSTKGGITPAKQLKPDDKGRVTLRRDGKSHRLTLVTFFAREGDLNAFLPLGADEAKQFLPSHVLGVLRR
jgi:hypothetical protein